MFAPSGTTLYTVYNVDPVNSTATGNIGQLMMADPDNLLITMGIQTPEFFAGKIVVSADGTNAYALSDSGFVSLPLSTISQSALAEPASDVLLLANDQCGVSTTSTSALAINNPGKVKGDGDGDACYNSRGRQPVRRVHRLAPVGEIIRIGTHVQLQFRAFARLRHDRSASRFSVAIERRDPAFPDRVRVINRIFATLTIVGRFYLSRRAFQ